MGRQPDDTVLGIDIGGTKALIAIVSREGQILHSYKYPMKPGTPGTLLDKLTQGIDHVLSASGGAPAAIGVGLKGHVDASRKVILSSSLIDMEGSFDLCSALSQRYSIPAAIDNDVNAATLAEAAMGAGKTADHFVYVNIGTGSAIGIYENGTLLRGQSNNSGEIGYMLCRRSGEDQTLFCMEDVASGKGLNNEIRRLAPKYPNSMLQESMRDRGAMVGAAEIFSACHEGDELAAHAVDNAIDALATCILNFECLLDCGLYIFGGGIVNDPWFFAQLQSRVRQISAEAQLPFAVEMRMSDLGAANVALLGAACIAFAALEK